MPPSTLTLKVVNPSYFIVVVFLCLLLARRDTIELIRRLDFYAMKTRNRHHHLWKFFFSLKFVDQELHNTSLVSGPCFIFAHALKSGFKIMMLLPEMELDWEHDDIKMFLLWLLSWRDLNRSKKYWYLFLNVNLIARRKTTSLTFKLRLITRKIGFREFLVSESTKGRT